jgi:hypothetical protein
VRRFVKFQSMMNHRQLLMQMNIFQAALRPEMPKNVAICTMQARYISDPTVESFLFFATEGLVH